MGTNNNRKKTLDQDTKLAAGFVKHFANETFMVLDGQVTGQDVADVLQGRIARALSVQQAKAVLRAAVIAELAELRQTGAFVGAVRSIVKAMFQNPNTLADFGLANPKITKKTVATKVASAAKAKATRAARGTKGPKQLAQIKGQVTTKSSP